MKINEEYLKEVFDDNNNLISLEPVYDKNFNFAYDVMDRLANEYENDIALVYKSLKGNVRKFTYGEMKNLSDKAANVFLNNGIKRNDSVMLILKRNYNFWISMLALHKIGAVAIPTSHMVSDDDIKERIEKADVKAIVLLDDVHILKNVEKGDMFTLDSASRILWERHLVFDGAQGSWALLAALDDLVEKGTLERKTMVHDVPSGTSHVNVYVVL